MKKFIVPSFLSICLMATFLLPISPSSTAYASSASVGTITPNNSVAADTTITFQINATGFVNPYYTVSDSFPGSTLSNSNINRFGYFSWKPSSVEIGLHYLTITVADSANNRSTINQTIEIRPYSPLVLKDLAPGSSISPGKPVSFMVAALGYVNPSFSVSDPFPGSTVSIFDINSYGNFNWTPKSTDVGVHNLMIRATSPSGRADAIYQTITVNGLSVQNLSSNEISVGRMLTFSIITYGITSPTYRITDMLPNNTSDSFVISGNNFSWTPQNQDIGLHTFTIHGTDVNGTVTSIQLNIRVLPSVVTQPAPAVQSQVIQAPNTTVKPTPTTTTPVSGSTQTVKPTASTKFLFTKALNMGSTGKDVTELQKRLIAEKFYSGPITGTYGALTKAAVMKYQKAKGLTQLGTVGPGTRAALNK